MNSDNNITILQNKLKQLQKENNILKDLLKKAGVSYEANLTGLNEESKKEKYDVNQGARILSPNNITEDMAQRFYLRFWGRKDVYSKRIVSKKTGKAGYYPCCKNFWKYGCLKMSKKGNCKECKIRDFEPITLELILAHLLGNIVIGVYPLFLDNTCRFLVFDFDNHQNVSEDDFVNLDDEWIEEVNTMRKICVLNGIDPLVERSRSGKGAHIWLFFEQPISARLARKFGYALLEKGAEQVNLKSFNYYDRMIPAQDTLPKGGLGNLIALPLQADALKCGNSAFVDENWNAYPNQWQALFSKIRLSQAFMEEKIKEWYKYKDDEKPLENECAFDKNEVDGVLNIVLSNGIYINTSNLNVSIQNKIRKLARISNPVFYKRQGMGFSTIGLSRYIYLGQDYESGYVRIPRGCFEKLISYISQAKIQYTIDDKRVGGNSIHVEFNGQLKQKQEEALDTMIEFDNGILHATTAFGKTVVGAALIAKKKVNTLILIENSTLMDQWKKELNAFLIIDESLPEYTTKSGQIRKRKSLIGCLQGAHDSMTGIIDIAMVGSLCKKGEFHKLLNQYGMVIVDECHHAASNTESNVLQKIQSKYVYGMTATTNRTDHLDSLNYMLLGPVRYRFTAKEKAMELGIPLLVYPRFTHTVIPRGIMKDEKNANEAYEILRKNQLRDEFIIRDIKQSISESRTPVVLSKFVDHCEYLANQLKNCADYLFLLTGKQSKKENDRLIEEMKRVPDDKSLILIATGSLVGEGFNFKRLDTLFMATPISGSSVVEQYLGRLHREYPNKVSAIVYDYVDAHIPMFDKMYAKRLKVYKKLGYSILSYGKVDYEENQSIFDGDNYGAVLKKDLLNASKNIIISSPSIRENKVSKLIDLVKEKQENGIEVTVVTWQADTYKYGDSNFRLQLFEEIRQAGFYLKTKVDSCEHYAIIDSEIVWYGNINLLGKSDVEDSIMRVQNKEIANELLELTFKEKEESHDIG